MNFEMKTDVNDIVDLIDGDDQIGEDQNEKLLDLLTKKDESNHSDKCNNFKEYNVVCKEFGEGYKVKFWRMMHHQN